MFNVSWYEPRYFDPEERCASTPTEISKVVKVLFQEPI